MNIHIYDTVNVPIRYHMKNARECDIIAEINVCIICTDIQQYVNMPNHKLVCRKNDKITYAIIEDKFEKSKYTLHLSAKDNLMIIGICCLVSTRVLINGTITKIETPFSKMTSIVIDDVNKSTMYTYSIISEYKHHEDVLFIYPILPGQTQLDINKNNIETLFRQNYALRCSYEMKNATESIFDDAMQASTSSRSLSHSLPPYANTSPELFMYQRSDNLLSTNKTLKRTSTIRPNAIRHDMNSPIPNITVPTSPKCPSILDKSIYNGKSTEFTAIRSDGRSSVGGLTLKSSNDTKKNPKRKRDTEEKEK
jgi:hypothetical protein